MQRWHIGSVCRRHRWRRVKLHKKEKDAHMGKRLSFLTVGPSLAGSSEIFMASSIAAKSPLPPSPLSAGPKHSGRLIRRRTTTLAFSSTLSPAHTKHRVDMHAAVCRQKRAVGVVDYDIMFCDTVFIFNEYLTCRDWWQSVVYSFTVFKSPKTRWECCYQQSEFRWAQTGSSV